MSVTPPVAEETPQGAALTAAPQGSDAPTKRGRLARGEAALKAWLVNKPIHTKLKVVIMIVCNATLLVAAMIFFTYDVVSEISRLHGSSAALGEVTGANCRTSLIDGNKLSAASLVNALMTQPSVVGAGLYHLDGNILAKTGRSSVSLPPKVSTAATTFSFGGVQHVEPIFENGKRLGTLVIESDMHTLYGRGKSYAIATIAILLIASFSGRWLTSRIGGVIVEPVVELSSVAKAVASSADYGLRAKKLGDDEVGQLVEHFNTMLGEVQKRDEAITVAQLELENKVLERTSELNDRIEEGKRNQELSRENETRYRNLFESNPMPMFVMDLETLAFVAVNNAAMKHYGYSQEEFLHMSLPGITIGAEPTVVIRAFRSSAKSFNAGEWKHRRKSAPNIEVEIVAHAILYSGKVAKIILTNDVTARNETQRQVEELHRKLVETSRQAGMAEVATGVLHNVGNVLNSVNVSATVLADSVKQTKATSLKRVVGLLEANKSDLAAFFSPGGKGQMLPGYLASLNDQIEQEQNSALTELSQLTKNIAHIKDIVAMQQNYAKVTGVLENHSPRVLVEEALQLSSAENKRLDVAVELMAPAEIPDVFVDRHQVMQILVNLLTNARQAVVEHSDTKRRVCVSLEASTTMVRVSIRDYGCGIPEENLTLIFNHGFTTKKDGHGFGLHSAANSAKEMGGGLSAESDGAGTGATFHLDLPTHVPAAAKPEAIAS